MLTDSSAPGCVWCDGLGGGHRLCRHTMVGFVGGGDAGKGYMMSGQRWLATVHIFKAGGAPFRTFRTPKFPSLK